MDAQRFQSLPSLALEKVANKCDDISLFQLALSLSDTKASFQPKKRPIKCMSINLKGPCLLLRVHFATNVSLAWHFCPMRVWCPFLGANKKFQIGRMVGKCSVDDDRIYVYSDSFIAMYQRVVNTLFHIFTPIRLMCILSAQINVPRFMESLNFQNTELFCFRATCALRNQDFMIVWETARPSKLLSFESRNDVIQQPKRDLLVNYPELHIYHGRWVTEDMFLATNSKKMSLRETNLRNTSVNRYIKNWVNGMKENLEDLLINIENPSLDEIVVGLNSNSTEEVRTEISWENKTLDFSGNAIDGAIDEQSARHITRNDGARATIGITERGMIRFVVWSAAYPVVRDQVPIDDFE